MKPRLNVIWNEIYCKRCNICVEVCPEGVLSLEMDEIIEKPGCIRCYQCERYCPDLAIEVMDERDTSQFLTFPPKADPPLAEET